MQGSSVEGGRPFFRGQRPEVVSEAPPASGLLPVDLWRARLVGPLLRGRLAQGVVQWMLVVGYLAVMLLGWGYDGIPGVPAPHPLMYTHASTLLFWVVWFMGLVLLTPLIGRTWCAVCPLGFLADIVGRRGLGFAWPRWLSSGAAIVFVFMAGVGAVVWGDVHKSPHRTAIFVGVVGAVAIISALVWRRNGFCRGLCPVGSALHLYSRHAPVSVRPLNHQTCRSCSDRSCTNRRQGWRRWDLGNWVLQLKGFEAGCPVALDPPTMDPGACLLCLRCARECSKQNLGVFWGRGPGFRAMDNTKMLFLVLLGGLVSLALLRTWPAAKELLVPGLYPPAWVASLWLGLVLPAFVVLGPAALAVFWARLRGTPVGEPEPGQRAPARRTTEALPSFWEIAQRHVPAFVGPVLGAHAAIALVKLNAKAGYVPYLGYDPTGTSTYLAIHLAKTLALPDLLLPLAWLRWVALAFLGLGMAAGVREGVKSWPMRGGTWVLYSVSFFAFSGLLGASLFHWLFPWGR